MAVYLCSNIEKRMSLTIPYLIDGSLTNPNLQVGASATLQVGASATSVMVSLSNHITHSKPVNLRQGFGDRARMGFF
jgi:hypothetical protein